MESYAILFYELDVCYMKIIIDQPELFPLENTSTLYK